MLVSRLRHRIQFYDRVEESSGWGGSTYIYKPVFTEWAEVRSVPGGEFREKVFTYSKVPYRIVIRYREGINAKMRIRNLTDGMLFDVEALRDPDGKRKILELQCLWREDQQDLE